MIIKKIYYDDKYIKQLMKIPTAIKKKAIEKEKILRDNPFHPSLRLHKLKGKLEGLWSISINKKFRAIFKPQGNGEILFLSIGVHSIYEE